MAPSQTRNAPVAMLRKAGRLRPSPKARAQIARIARVALMLLCPAALVALPAALHGRWGAWPSARHAVRPGRTRLPSAAPLAEALAAWTEGRMPEAVVAAAREAKPRDAADAVLAAKGAGGVASAVVVDVGANKGWPVTKLSLQVGVARVVSIEPDKRNFEVLRKLPQANPDTYYAPMRGAAGRNPGKQSMMFHKLRDDFTCFNCLDVKKEDVFQEDVQVYTVDGALGDFTDRVTLLKTDTQGFEVEVLSGAIQTLSSGRAENVMAEFDHRLLRTRETALELLSLLINQYHYDCTHLAFAGRPKDAGPLAPFEFLPITSMGAEAFLDYVTASGGYTDLFCSKR